MKKFFKLFSVMIMAFLTTNVLADDYVSETKGNFTIQYDNFDKSEVVNARFNKNITLDTADYKEFSNNISIKDFSFSKNSSFSQYIMYHGPLDTLNGTNNLNESFTLRWNDAIKLADGSNADFEITISDITIEVRPHNAGNVNLLDDIKSNYNNTFYFPLLSNSIGATTDNVGIAIDNTTKKIVSPTLGNVTVDLDNGIKFKVTMKAYQNGAPLIKDSSMLFGVQDLDFPSNISGTIQEKLSNKYTEGIELVSGFGTIHSGDYNSTSNSYNNTNEGYLRISPDSSRADTLYSINDNNNYEINSKYNDNYLSGFLTSATISGNGSEFYWTGSSDCGTRLFTNFRVLIKQEHNNGGTVSVSSNINTNQVSLDNSTSEDYFSGSDVTYYYNPSKGYYVNNVLIDDNPINFDRNGSIFNFSGLIYNPLLNNSQSSLERSITVQFAPYNFELHYLHEDKSEDENLMPHKDLSFDEEGKLAKNKYEKENYVFYRWKVLDENKQEILDSNGKPILLKNEDDLSKIYELDVNFDGGKVYLQAQFTEKSILNPKTYDSNSLLFIVITFISFGGIVTLLVKNSKKLKKSN